MIGVGLRAREPGPGFVCFVSETNSTRLPLGPPTCPMRSAERLTRLPLAEQRPAAWPSSCALPVKQHAMTASAESLVRTQPSPHSMVRAQTAGACRQRASPTVRGAQFKCASRQAECERCALLSTKLQRSNRALRAAQEERGQALAMLYQAQDCSPPAPVLSPSPIQFTVCCRPFRRRT